MVFVVGNWALQVVASQKPSVPAVYAMVLNPPAILGADARNITGASMNVPVEQSLSLIRQLGPSFKRVGVIFNPARTGYLVKQAEGVAWRVWSAPSRSASCRSRASRGQSPLST